MDDLKKKLAFPNASVQLQAISKLTQLVRKSQSTTKIKDEGSQTPEVTLLLECLCSPNAIVTNASGQALVQLVQDDIADFTFILNSVISYGPSVRVPSGVCEAVGDLLCLQVLAVEAMGDTYRCPYSIRSSPHPLTSLLVNMPEAWLDITQQISRIFNHHDKRIQTQAVAILRPFIAFALLEPQQSDQYSQARDRIRRCLVDVCASGSHQKAAAVNDFVLLVFERLQMMRKESIIDNCVFLEGMAKAISNRLLLENTDNTPADVARDYWQDAACKWLKHCLEMGSLCLESNLAITGLVEAAMSLSNNIPSLNPRKNDVILCLLSSLLSNDIVYNNPSVLELATTIVEQSQAPNPLCLALLVSPLLGLLSTTSSLGHQHTAAPRHVKHTVQIGQALLEIVKRRIRSSPTRQCQNYDMPSCLSEKGLSSGMVSFILCDLLKNESGNRSTNIDGDKERCADGVPTELVTWLTNVHKNLSTSDHCTVMLVNLVTAILVTSRDAAVIKAAVQVIVKIAMLDPNKAPNFLAVLLHAIGEHRDPDVRLVLFTGIPLTATHKYCVPAALKTIQALATEPSLHPLSIRLMVMLWQKHDRTFAHMLRMVSDTTSSTSINVGIDVDDLMLAKAAAIYEMCKLRPQQHGAELLQPLSDILTAASDERNTTASAILIDGLYLLCQAEVIDIRSLWSVLGDKLMHETRSLVVTKICKLLSIVPVLRVETPEYEVFLQETVTNLWLYTLSTDTSVKVAAYKALADFPQDLIKVSHFSRDITEEFHEKTDQENSNLEPDASEMTVDELFPVVPGYVFMSLLQTFDDDTQLEAYESFLEAIAKTEVENLPRGVFYSALRRQGPSGKEGRALKSIPALLLKQWDQCRHPGLRPGLAVGLLFSYDPPVEVARDGRPRKHYVIRHGKAYLQMFNTLLQEVAVQPSDWRLFPLTPHAWLSFVERLFVAALESRKAELDLQEEHSHATAVELKEKKTLAWLWARDAIFDMVKSASKGNPSTQANSVLALACLARCLHRFAADLDATEMKAANESSEYRGHAQWMVMTVDSIRHVIDNKYYPKETLHDLWQQGSRPGNRVGVAMARVAASLLVPVLVQMDTDCILDLLQCFSSNLPSGSKPLTASVMTALNSFALGNLLGRLFEEHFSDMTGSKGMLAVWRSLSALEEFCLSCDEEHGQVAMLALRAAITGLCNEGKTESRAHVKSIVDKLHSLWKTLDVHHAAYQTLTVTLASINASLYSTSLSKDDEILTTLETIKQMHQKDPQIPGLAHSLGLLVHTLAQHGHQTIKTWQHDLVTTWSQELLDEEIPTLEKVSKLTGLLALVGSEQSAVSIKGSSTPTKSDVNNSDVITTLTKILTDSNEPGLKNVSAGMLGHLYMSACDTGDSRASAPSSYSYLPESSCLRAIVDFLHKAGRFGAEVVRPHQVLAAIRRLNVRKPLPPLNWPGVLSPFMRMNFGNDVKTVALEVAANQMTSSTTASMFLTSWLTPPLFYSLSPDTQSAMHRHLPNLLRSWSPSVLKTYLERCWKPAFSDNSKPSVQMSALSGLRDALAVKDPPASVTMLLNELIGEMYHCLSQDTGHSLLTIVSECLAEVPDDVLDSIIVADFADVTSVIKGSFIRGHLVASGSQPLSLLNYMVDASFNTDFWSDGYLPGLLSHCLSKVCRIKSGMSLVERQQWLSEFLGHTRSVLTGAMPLADTAPPMKKVIHHIITLVTTFTLALAYPHFIGIEFLGLDLNLFSGRPTNSQGDAQSDSENRTLEQHDGLSFGLFSAAFEHISKLLPCVVTVLEKKPWTTLAPKMVDWLTTVIHLPDINDEDKNVLIDSLTSMRHCQDFKQASVWSNAFMLPF